MRLTRAKLLLGIKILLLATIILSAFNGCKKDNTIVQMANKDQIAIVKDWYEARQKGISSSINSSKGEKIRLVFDPNWNQAKIEQINKNIVYDIPVNTNLKKLEGEDTQYHLIVEYDGKDFKSKTVSFKNLSKDNTLNSVQDLYYTAFSKKDLSEDKIITASVKVFNERLAHEKVLLYTENGKQEILYNKQKSKINTANSANLNDMKTAVVVTRCTDWYLEIIIRDSNGNIIYYSDEYMGETCEEREVEVRDSIEPEPNGTATDLLEGGAVSEAVSSTGVTETTDANGVKKRSWSESWKFAQHKYRTSTFFGISTELAKTQKVDTSWVWIAVTNQSYYTAGIIPPGFEYVKDGWAANYDSKKATIQFTSHLSFVGVDTRRRATAPVSEFYQILKR